MAYKLLGIVIWKVAKSLLRYRYSAAMEPKRLLAGGGALLTIAGILFAARARCGGD